MDDTKIFYTFPYWTKIDKWQIWDARRDWTFTEYHVWFGSSTTDLTKYATYSFNPTSQWDGGTPNNQTQTFLSVGSEQVCKVMAFSFTDPTTNPNNSNATIAGVGVNEIKIWGYQSATSASSLVLTFPKLDFDGYNKLTTPVLDASSTGTRLSDWDNSNQSKTIVANLGDWPESTAGITEHNVLQNGDKSYQKTNGGTSRDSAQLFTTVISGDWANASHGANGIHSPMTWGYKFTTGAKLIAQMILTQPPGNSHTAGNVTIKYWDGSAMVTVSNQSPTGMSSQSYNSSTTFTFDSVSAQYWQIDCYKGSSNGTTYTGIHGWQLLSGPDPVTTVITNGSDSYDIGTASSIYITDTGTYDAQAKNSNTFVIKTSKQVNTLATKPDYTNIWAGEYAGMIIDSDGKLYTWGNDGNNESGRGAQDRTPTHLSTISDPISNVWVEGAPGRTRIVKTSTDKWYMWGMNSSFNKIFGETTNQTTPVDVTSYFTTHFGAQGASDSTRIVKVVMSSAACSALAADGKVWSWGKDESRNELGKNTNTTTATPFKNTTDGTAELSNITDIRSLHYGKIALDSNGDVWQWGQLRTGSTGYATKPFMHGSYVNISIDSGSWYGNYEYRVMNTSNPSTGYIKYDLWDITTQTFASTGHAIKVRLSDNTWYDSHGQMDPDTVTDNGTTVTGEGGGVVLFVFTKPSNVITGSVNIIGIGSSFFTAYAWDAAGTIYSIGQGSEGQLGNGAYSNKDSPWQTVTTLQGKTIYGIYGGVFGFCSYERRGICVWTRFQWSVRYG